MQDNTELIYILGSGLSAKPLVYVEGTFDNPQLINNRIPELRKEGYVLGINRAIRHVECDGVMSLDVNFANEEQSKHKWKALGKHAHTVWANKQELKFATNWERNDKADPDPATPTVVGCGTKGLGEGKSGSANAGLAAIGVALNLGAKCIVLIGIDLDEENKQWLPLEKDCPKLRFKLEHIKHSFERCGRIFKEKWPHVRILNASPVSSLNEEWYPKIDQEKIFNREYLLRGY